MKCPTIQLTELNEFLMDDKETKDLEEIGSDKESSCPGLMGRKVDDLEV